jgi:hypothetical protein
VAAEGRKSFFVRATSVFVVIKGLIA